uniref:Uncharacterized protein n=1 Tax=Romanomermis culicivorax TaxID=13658 RepID=A0A915IZL6_ROMCU
MKIRNLLLGISALFSSSFIVVVVSVILPQQITESQKITKQKTMTLEAVILNAASSQSSINRSTLLPTPSVIK